METPISPDISLYVRLLSGMILGIAVGKVLSGIGHALQTKHIKPDTTLQAFWALFVFGTIAQFWWGEANTFGQVTWTYHLYLFQVIYCCTYLAVCVLLFPGDLDEYDSYFDYLVQRRVWLIGALIFSHVLGYFDTFVKEGAETFGEYLSTWYEDLFLLVPLTVAMISRSRRVHYIIAGLLAALMVLALAIPE